MIDATVHIIGETTQRITDTLDKREQAINTALAEIDALEELLNAPRKEQDNG